MSPNCMGLRNYVVGMRGRGEGRGEERGEGRGEMGGEGRRENAKRESVWEEMRDPRPAGLVWD